MTDCTEIKNAATFLATSTLSQKGDEFPRKRSDLTYICRPVRPRRFGWNLNLWLLKTALWHYKQLLHLRMGLPFLTMALFFLWLKSGLSHLLFHQELLNPLLAIFLQAWGSRGITALIYCWKYWQELRYSSHWRPWIFTIVIHCGKCFHLVLSLHF